jgi:hypothetical protein
MFIAAAVRPCRINFMRSYPIKRDQGRRDHSGGDERHDLTDNSRMPPFRRRQVAKLIAEIATGQVEDRETAPEVKREKRVRSANAPHDLRDSEKKSTKK